MRIRGYLAFFVAAVCCPGADATDASALNRKGAELEGQGRYREAEAQFHHALELCRPTKCSELPAILNNLGSLYYETKRYPDAEPLLRQAIDLGKEADWGPAELASAFSNLAAVYGAEARFSEAAELYERALELREKEPGDRPALPKLLTTMAMLFQEMGQLERAEATARRAVAIFASNGQQESADALACVTNLAGILEAENKVAEAHQQLESVLAIQERELGPNHVAVARTLNKLGLVYRRQGQPAEAVQRYQRSVEILRANPITPDLGAVLNNLGYALATQERWKEAEERLREAISIWQKVLGPDHPDITPGLTNLAQLLQSRHHYNEAASLLERVRRIDEKHFPADHPRIGLDLSNSASIASARKHYGEAEQLFLQSLSILETSLPAGHPDIGRVLANLGELYRTQKRLAESARMYKQGLDILVKAWGPEDQRLPEWMERYAQVLRALEDYAEAARLDVQATRIRVTHGLR